MNKNGLLLSEIKFTFPDKLTMPTVKYTARFNYYTSTIDNFLTGEAPESTEHHYLDNNTIQFETIAELKQKIADFFCCNPAFIGISLAEGNTLDCSWLSESQNGDSYITDEIYAKFSNSEQHLYAIWLPISVQVTYDVDCHIFNDQLD